jgi:hypothetical protein
MNINSLVKLSINANTIKNRKVTPIQNRNIDKINDKLLDNIT